MKANKISFVILYIKKIISGLKRLQILKNIKTYHQLMITFVKWAYISNK